MSDSSGEKSFAPSPRRRRDAAARGDVLRSRELATLVAIAVGAAWLHFAGPWLLDVLARALRLGLVWDRSALVRFDPGVLLLPLLLLALPPVLVLGGSVMIASFASQLVIGDGRFVAGNLAPKSSRVDPQAGLKRIFGAEGWIELGKGLAKAGVLGAIAAIWARHNVAALTGLGRVGLAGQLAYGWQALTSLLLGLAGGLLVIALADLPLQWMRRQQRLMMTLQELKDEHKESEGSPANRAAIRSRQRQLAMSGVAGMMRQAQFVVTNPSHFAVAMAYDPGRAAAPSVVARGRGEKALAMRELAAALAVPVLEYPLLARSFYFTTRERQVIREELYIAVATVLAFVLALKRGEQRAAPEIEVPLTLRFDAEGQLDPRAAG